MPVVLIGGDICPIGSNTSHFRSGDAEQLFHDLRPLFDGADLVIANLECPLIGRPTPIAKTGPVFGADPACIAGIREGGIDVLGVANNHIMDHGPAGLESTLTVCASAGVGTVGAGENVASARRILVRRVGGVRIGVLAMAEHEFSIATATRPGANPLDLIDFVRNVRSSRQSFDHLIVLLHGGPEFLTAPSLRLREACRFLVEMGANAVVVQHPHSFGGYEEYRGGHIVYGQGALIMDEAIYRARPSFHEGLLVSLDIDVRGEATLELIPFVQSDPVPGARRMEPGRAAILKAELAAKAARVQDDEGLRDEWIRFCDERKHAYMSAVRGHNGLLRRLNRWGHLGRLFYNRRTLLATRNVITCETHRDALQTILEEELV